MLKHFIFISLSILLAVGCTPLSTPTQLPATETASPVPPTDTPEPTATPTDTPTATPLPGVILIPVEQLASNIPWLPSDPDNLPVIQTLIFDLQVPPFDDARVRQAFALAIDRGAALAVAEEYLGDYRYASTFTPAWTLGRDLYGEVGLSYDPDRARQLLQEAGLSDPSSHPEVTLIVPAYGTKYPYARTLIANELAEMWQTNLGITVLVRSLTMPQMTDARQSGTVGIIFQGWVNELNDPDTFLRGLMRSDSIYNNGHYASREFDTLVDRAYVRKDPAERQALYIQAEQLLCELDVAVYPLYSQNP